MKTRFWLFAIVPALLVGGVVGAQGPILMDLISNRVIQKYQSATCEQLWEKKGQPKSAEEQKFIQFLRSEPSERATFINKVAGPIVNKMFECGLIP